MEVELKFGLTAQTHRVLSLLARGKPVYQRNTYFDVQGKLRRAGAGLRLREVLGKAPVLTFKLRTPETAKLAKGGLHKRQEWECRITTAQAARLRTGRLSWESVNNKVSRELRRAFPKLDLATLQPIGSVLTERKNVKFGQLKGELDRTQIGRHVFEELEIETTNPEGARKVIVHWFKELGIPVRPKKETKLAALYRLS